MRSFLLTLGLLLPAVAAAQDFGARFPTGSITTREQASQALEAADKEYARVQVEFDARDAAVLPRNPRERLPQQGAT